MNENDIQRNERFKRINACLLSLDNNHQGNIDRLTALCGELLGADSAFFNRLEGGLLCSIGQWHAPAGYEPNDRPEGHVCYDVIRGDNEELLLVRDLPHSRYSATDPNVGRYGLQTYLGQVVRVGEGRVGTLCAVYRRDFQPSPEDLDLLKLLATLVSQEDARRQAEQTLQEAMLAQRASREQAEEETRRDEQRLRSLLKIAQAKPATLRELLDGALEEAIALSGSQLGYIFYYSEEMQELTLYAWSRRAMQICTIPNPPRVYELDQTGVWGEPVRQRRPLIMNDFQAPSPLKKGYPEGHAPLYRYMTLPIIVDGRVVAVVGVGNKETDYTEQDVRQLGQMMDAVWEIAERQRAEDSLRESELRYRALFVSTQRQAQEMLLLDRVRIAMARTLDLDELFRSIVEGVAETFGYTMVSIYLLQGQELVMQYQCGSSRPIIRIPITSGVTGRVVRTAQPVLIEDVSKDPDFLVSADGIVSELCVPLFDQGQVCGIFNVESQPPVALGADDLRLMVALSEHIGIAIGRARIYAELRASEERYRSFVENFQGIAYRGRMDFTPIFFHGAVQAITGYHEANLLAGQPRWDQIILPADRPGMEESFRRVAQEPGYSTEREYRILRQDGEIRWLHELIRNVPGDDWQPFYVQGVIIDITERKRLQEQMFEAQKLAGLGTLAAGIAHELNTPLQVVTGVSESLVERLKTGMMEQEILLRNLEIIRRNGWRTAEIIRLLLSYARPSAGQVEEHNLNDLVSSALPLIQHQLETGSNIALTIDLAADLPALRCNAGQVKQALINLLSNGRDAMPRGGSMTIRTCWDAVRREALLQVADSGPGIPPEVREHLFEPFFTTKPPGQGVGLGLPVVASIVHSHGGEVRVENAEPHGTIITLVFPLEQPHLDEEGHLTDSTYGRYGEK